MTSLRSRIAETFAASILTVALTMSPVRAATLDFSFTFTNAIYGGGTVKGIILGLSEGTGAASSVKVISNTDGHGLGEYVGTPHWNSWTIRGGRVTDFSFLSFGRSKPLPERTDSTLLLDSSALNGQTFRAALSYSDSSVATFGSQLSTASYALTFERYVAPEVEPVPLPATGLLLLAGLGGLGLFRRRAA